MLGDRQITANFVKYRLIISLKSLSLKDYLKRMVYQRHDNSLAFDQECIKERLRFDFVCQ